MVVCRRKSDEGIRNNARKCQWEAYLTILSDLTQHLLTMKTWSTHKKQQWIVMVQQARDNADVEPPVDLGTMRQQQFMQQWLQGGATA